MMLKRRYIALGFAAMLLVGTSAMPAQAKPSDWAKTPYSAPSSFAPSSNNLPQWAQRSISASEAKSIALRLTGGGQVVDIKRKGNTYSVRVIRKDGRVVDVLIDATTGRVR